MQIPSNLFEPLDTPQLATPAVLDAALAVRYLNAQLFVNHNLATNRFRAFEGKHTSEEHRLSYAWAKYTSRQKGDGPVLEFTFEAPRIFFACDHDAILKLTLSANKISPDGKTLEPIPELYNFEVSFRVTTEKRTILGNDVKVGDHESRIHLLVFDFDHALLLDSEDEQEVLKEHDLQRHLTSYLKTLQVGGHHVLFFPPEFDENDLRSPVRFSLSGNSAVDIPPVLNKIHDYTLEMINGYLSLIWYTCAFIARQKGAGPAWDDTTCLAGYQTWLFSDYDAPWHASFRFTSPRVTILCAKEVVLHFSLSEVSFYSKTDILSPDFDEKVTADYTDWEIALIVEVTATKTTLRINPSSANFSSEHSKRTEFKLEGHEKAYDLLVEFFVERYFKLVAATRLEYLFHRIRDQHALIRGSTIDNDGSWWTLEQDYRSSISALAATIKHTKMEGFDIAVAISQSSINAQFLRLFRSDESTRWVRDAAFRVEVKTMSVQLLDSTSRDQLSADEAYDSDDENEQETHANGHDTKEKPPPRRAVVTVHVLEGILGWVLDEHNLDINPSDTPQTFGECQLAFEVDLREKEDSLDEATEEDYCPRAYEHPRLPSLDPNKKSDDDAFKLRHIYLDLENAQFSARHSVLEDDEYGEKEVMLRRMTLAERIKTVYFKSLVKRGAHIIATIPIYQKEARHTFYRFTNMTFRTYSVETEMTSLTEEEETVKRSDQILFVLGMTGNRTLPPIMSFIPSKSWLLRGRFSHGLLAISRNTFLLRLHALLARVNAVTTLVPSGRPKGRGEVQIWDRHPERKKEACTWTPVNGQEDGNATEYEWKYAQDWRIQEASSLAIMNRALAVHCTTHNRLELPDVFSLSDGSLVIKMSGELHLRMHDARHNESWSTESTAFWSVTISIKTSKKGNVEVDIDGVDNIHATPAKTTRRGHAFIPEVQSILQKHLPKRKDFDNVLHELKELQGDWNYYFPAANWFTLCTPMFNIDGDLLFELRRSQTKPHSSRIRDAFLESPISPGRLPQNGPGTGNDGDNESEAAEETNEQPRAQPPANGSTRAASNNPPSQNQMRNGPSPTDGELEPLADTPNSPPPAYSDSFIPEDNPPPIDDSPPPQLTPLPQSPTMNMNANMPPPFSTFMNDSPPAPITASPSASESISSISNSPPTAEQSFLPVYIQGSMLLESSEKSTPPAPAIALESALPKLTEPKSDLKSMKQSRKKDSGTPSLSSSSFASTEGSTTTNIRYNIGGLQRVRKPRIVFG